MRRDHRQSLTIWSSKLRIAIVSFSGVLTLVCHSLFPKYYGRSMSEISETPTRIRWELDFLTQYERRKLECKSCEREMSRNTEKNKPHFWDITDLERITINPIQMSINWSCRKITKVKNNAQFIKSKFAVNPEIRKQRIGETSMFDKTNNTQKRVCGLHANLWISQININVCVFVYQHEQLTNIKHQYLKNEKTLSPYRHEQRQNTYSYSMHFRTYRNNS